MAHITSPVQVSTGITAAAMGNTYVQLLSKVFIIIIIIIIIIPKHSLIYIKAYRQHKRNGSHPDVFKDSIQGLHQSNTSYLF